jgi:uncharacterized protein YdaU (DUF1376 family)
MSEIIKLRYFTFDAMKWLSIDSRVQLLSYEEKGIFIELCARIFCENGVLINDELLHRKMRIEKQLLTNCLNLLSELKLLLFEGNKMSVKFIDEEIKNVYEKSKTYSENGRKGGRPKSKRKLPLKGNEIKGNEIKDKNKEQLDGKTFNIPTGEIKAHPSTVLEVKEEANKIGYAMTDEEAENFMAHYAASNWLDRFDRPVRDWPKLLVRWKNNARNKPMGAGSAIVNGKVNPKKVKYTGGY